MKQNLVQTLLDGPLAISGTTVDVTNDIVWGEVVNITNADAVLTNRKKTVFELTKVNIVNNVVTFTKRGLTKSETETEDVGLKKSWKKGDYLYITVLAPSFISIDNSQPRQSPQDFSGYTNTFGDTIHNGYAKFQGTTNPGVVFNEFTTAQREALTPIGPAIVYDTTVGEWYKYSGSVWTQISTGGTFPRASETVEGKVRIQTEDEYLAGSDTGGDGATLVQKPSKINEKITEIETELEEIANLTDATFMLGEPCTKGDSLFKEVGPTFAEATTAQNIGDVAGNTRVSIPVIGSGIAGGSLKLALAKADDLGEDLTLRIETDNAEEPSGTEVTDGTATITRASLTTSLTDETITLAGTITLTEGVKYHIVLAQESDTVDPARYFKVGHSTNTTTTRPLNRFNGTDWNYTVATVTDDDQVTFDTSGTISRARGYKLQALTTISLTKINKNASVTATKFYVYNSDKVLLSSGTFSGNVGTLSTPVIITRGSIIYVATDADGASYTSYSRSTAGFPKVGTNVSYIAGIDINTGVFAEQTSGYNIDSIESNELGNTSLIPYSSSTLFANSLLSKTDATYYYKLPNDIPRFAKSNGVIGEKVKCSFKGIADLFTGLTEGSDYFLQDTPGAIGATAGTNMYRVGQAIDDTQLELPTVNYKVMTISRQLGVASGTVTYSHNMGKKPKLIQIYGTQVDMSFQGAWDGVNQVCTTYGNAVGQASSTQIILIYQVSNALIIASGIISNITNTTFDIARTREGSSSNTCRMTVILQA